MRARKNTSHGAHEIREEHGTLEADWTPAHEFQLFTDAAGNLLAMVYIGTASGSVNLTSKPPQ